MDSLSLFFYCSNCNALLQTLSDMSWEHSRQTAAKITVCSTCGEKIGKQNNLYCRKGTLTAQEDLSYSEQELVLYPQYKDFNKTLYFESMPRIELASREYNYTSKYCPETPRAIEVLEEFTQATDELEALLNAFGLALSSFGGPHLTLCISNLLTRRSSQDDWCVEPKAFVSMNAKFLLILQPLLQELKAYRDKYGDIPQAPYTNEGD